MTTQSYSRHNEFIEPPDDEDYVRVEFQAKHGDKWVKAYEESVPRESMREHQPILQRMQSLYDSGVPFFTKELIRSARQERDRIRDEKLDHPALRLRDLEGNMIDEKAYKLPIVFINGESYFDCLGDTKNRVRLELNYRPPSSFGYSKLGLSGDWLPNILTVGIAMIIGDEKHDIATNRPVETVRREFENDRSAWEASELRAHLWEFLTGPESPLARATKVVILASGSPDRWPPHPPALHASSSVQISLGLTVRDAIVHLRERLPKPSTAAVTGKEDGVDGDPQADMVRCFAQDPALTSSDREVLAPHGIEIVDDPEGFLLLDDSTAVLTFASNVACKSIVLDICRPLAFMCGGKDNFQKRAVCSLGEEEKFCGTDPWLPRMDKIMGGNYRETPFKLDTPGGTAVPLLEHFYGGLLFLKLPNTEDSGL